MLDDLVKQFLGSGAGQQAVQQLEAQGLSPQQAQGAVQVTAEGAAQHLGSGGGIAGMLGSLGGGGGARGIAGALGGLAGGRGGKGKLALPPQVVDTIAQTIASKVGIHPGMAKTVVDVVLPKVLEFARSKMGGVGGVGAQPG